MKKTIGIALLALTLGVPAAAQTYELTFSGSFTTLMKDYPCEGCPGGPGEPLREVFIPFSGTLNFTLAAQPTVTTYDFEGDGPLPASHSLRSSLVTGSPQVPASAFELDPQLTMPHGTAPATEYYQDTTAIDRQNYKQDTTTGEVFGATRTLTLYRYDIWTVSPDTGWRNFFTLSFASAVATPGSFEAPMTTASFMQTLQSLVGCVACMRAENQSTYHLITDDYSTLSDGTATLLSIREITPPVPEPSSMLLAASGVAAMMGLAWRRRRQHPKAN
jgi:hypothetical protein